MSEKLKIYLETSFFSYLTGRETPVELIALRQKSGKILIIPLDALLEIRHVNHMSLLLSPFAGCSSVQLAQGEIAHIVAFSAEKR